MIPESYVSSMQWSLDIAAVFWATNVSDRWAAFPVSKAARQPGSHEAGHDCWARLAAAIFYGRFFGRFPLSGFRCQIALFVSVFPGPSFRSVCLSVGLLLYLFLQSGSLLHL